MRDGAASQPSRSEPQNSSSRRSAVWRQSVERKTPAMNGPVSEDESNQRLGRSKSMDVQADSRSIMVPGSRIRMPTSDISLPSSWSVIFSNKSIALSPISCGWLDDGLLTFSYDGAYLLDQRSRAISLSMPLQEEPFGDELVEFGPLVCLCIQKGWRLGRTRHHLLLPPPSNRCIR